jgi:Flp pilus assembly protein TadD
MHKPPKDRDLRPSITEASSAKAVAKKPAAAKRKAAIGKRPRKRLAVSGISGVHEEGGKEQATAAAAVAAEVEPADEPPEKEEGGR